jgi:hypothetical protein
VQTLQAFHDAKIADREDVGPMQAEHQEHLRGPAAEAFDGGDRHDDLFIRKVLQGMEIQPSVLHMLGKIPEVRDLLPAEARGAERILIRGQHRRRRERLAAADEVDHPPLNGVGGLGRKLLRNDRAHQRMKRVAGLEIRPSGAHLLNKEAEPGVPPHQVAARPLEDFVRCVISRGCTRLHTFRVPLARFLWRSRCHWPIAAYRRGTERAMTPAPGNGNANGASLGYTRFLFVRGCREDDAARGKLKAAGDGIARGFLNAFELEGATSDAPALETIQFLSLNGVGTDSSAEPPARYAVQVNSRYRPRLDEVEKELRRRVGEAGEVVVLEGTMRAPQYSSADVSTWAYDQARAHASGRHLPNAIILPMRKNAAWWAMPTLERHQYFYPHHDRKTSKCVAGHASLGREAAPHIYRRLYHNPNGPGRPGEWDFVTYFECSDAHLDVFDSTLAAMRDPERNPEWRFVEEGPMWRGRRVIRW